MVEQVLFAPLSKRRELTMFFFYFLIVLSSYYFPTIQNPKDAKQIAMKSPPPILSQAFDPSLPTTHHPALPFICSFDKYLLSTHLVRGTTDKYKDTAQTNTKSLPSITDIFLVQRQTTRKNGMHSISDGDKSYSG